MHAALKPFAGRLYLTFALVLLEGLGWLLFPLVIGRAIDSALADSSQGLYELAGLGVVTMAIAICRRVFDSRFFAGIYTRLSEDLVTHQSDSSTSIKTARLGMLKEVVEFLENSLPSLIMDVLGLAGTVLILLALKLPIFIGCLVVTGATATLYALTGRLTTRYNEGLNNEYEQQVAIVDGGDSHRIAQHIRHMMRWNIKLSDLEAANFGIIWVFMVGLIVFSVRTAAESTVRYGEVFAVVMYVFRFIESIGMLPAYYQEWLRLREISGRLAAVEDDGRQ